MYDLVQLRKNSEPVNEYLISSRKVTNAFEESIRDYKLANDTKKKLRAYVGEAVVFAFSAEWCPDCHRNIPILGVIAEETGLEINIFGHLMRDLKKTGGIWRIPPSPPEVQEFNVRKIPTIIVLDLEGNKLGEIIENPPADKNLEEALLDILDHD